MAIPRRPPSEQLSHWYHLFPLLRLAPSEFYGELRGRVEGAAIEGVEVGPIEYPERGMFSVRRTYLRIARGDLVYDVCGAPFGRDAFFVSCWAGRMLLPEWLLRVLGVLMVIPGVGWLIEKALRPMTYYEIDTALMFKDTLHAVLMAYLDELAGTHGIVPLTAAERAAQSSPAFTTFRGHEQ